MARSAHGSSRQPPDGRRPESTPEEGRQEPGRLRASRPVDGEPTDIHFAGRRSRPLNSPDRYWRELSGAGHTNITGPAAARVRETPDFTDEELAEAARDVVIQRRNWSPT